MKILKRVILSIIILAVISVGGFFLVKRIQEQRIATIVKNGQIVVDDEFHTWLSLKNDDNFTTINIYLRNKSKYRVVGNLVFSVTLSEEGLEKEFLEEVIKIGLREMGESTLEGKLERGSEEGIIPSKNEAILNYIHRGRKLPQGKEYEPMNNKNPAENYVFKFREYVSLNSGEVTHFTSQQIIPPRYVGCPLTVDIENIEF